jgi:hypothetical protein
MSFTVSGIEEPRTIHLTNGNIISIESNASSTAETIPLIDIARIHSPNLLDRQALAEEIREASKEIGFFLITNHVSPLLPIMLSKF